MNPTKRILVCFSGLLLFEAIPRNAFAMHIMEGFLPGVWAGFWWIVSIPFIFWGVKRVNKLTSTDMNIKMLLGLCGAFVFVLSSLKIPSVTGSCSHPTGVGLGAILFGPGVACVLSFIALIFQALLLAHGGITTLGANVFSMGIAGPVASFCIYISLDKSCISKSVSVFCAAAAGNLITYIITALQLGFAFPSEAGGVMASIGKFLVIFALTQIPLAITEGIITVVVFNFLLSYNKDELKQLGILDRVV